MYGEVAEGYGEVGEVGVAVEGDEFASQVDGFLGGGQSFGATASVAKTELFPLGVSWRG